MLEIPLSEFQAGSFQQDRDQVGAEEDDDDSPNEVRVKFLNTEASRDEELNGKLI